VGQTDNVTTPGGVPDAQTFLTQAVGPGDTALPVTNITGFLVGRQVLIDPGTQQQEANVIIGFGSLQLQKPLARPHSIGAAITMPGAGGLTGWFDAGKTWFQQALQGPQKLIKQLGWNVQIVALISSLMSLLVCCTCVLCCWACCRRKKKRKVVGYDGETRTRSLRYPNGSSAREPNEEDASNDRTFLLSDRPERPPPMLRSEASKPWQDGPPGRGVPNGGYIDYRGAGPSAPPYNDPIGGGYRGRFVDAAPYGGLLDGSLPPGVSRARSGSLFDYAPQPLHPPPPQYYQQQEAYSRGRGSPMY
jgi:hypothetical protein